MYMYIYIQGALTKSSQIEKWLQLDNIEVIVMKLGYKVDHSVHFYYQCVFLPQKM